MVDIMDLTPEAKALLSAPKSHSYKTCPPDLGDYYHRYGIRRTLIDGGIVRLEVDRPLP